MKDKQGNGPENVSLCRHCLNCIQCCQLPASTGVKIVSVISILLGLVLACLGVWMTIVTTSNYEMQRNRQVVFFKRPTVIPAGQNPNDDSIISQPSNPNKSVIPGRKVGIQRTYLANYHSYLVALSLISLCVGIVRTISSIFLLWNSVEKHSKTPGKVWILLSIVETTTLFTFLIVTLNVTGFIDDVPWSPIEVRNDKFSFYLLLCIFRLVSFFDIFLTIYFILIVFWFVRTR